jgi:hypothetical protein
MIPQIRNPERLGLIRGFMDVVDASEKQEHDTIGYKSCGYHCFDQCILNVRIREGRIYSIEPDDTLNPGVAREVEHPTDRFLPSSQRQYRPWQKGYPGR